MRRAGAYRAPWVAPTTTPGVVRSSRMATAVLIHYWTLRAMGHYGCGQICPLARFGRNG